MFCGLACVWARISAFVEKLLQVHFFTIILKFHEVSYILSVNRSFFVLCMGIAAILRKIHTSNSENGATHKSEETNSRHFPCDNMFYHIHIYHGFVKQIDCWTEAFHVIFVLKIEITDLLSILWYTSNQCKDWDNDLNKGLCY